MSASDWDYRTHADGQTVYTYTDVDGDQLRIRYNTLGAPGLVIAANASGLSSMVNVKAEDVEQLITNIRDVMNGPCEHCKGSGRRHGN